MQPGGLRESSRWSDPDVSGEDHRYRVISMCILKGCQTSLRILHPLYLKGAVVISMLSGGLLRTHRDLTTGYSLSALGAARFR